MAKKTTDKGTTSESCISCGVRLTERGFTRFLCPECGEKIGRCTRCRQQSNPYSCAKCGFIGP
ncbi:MAG: zinc finger domain-containing protein [Methanocellales archaeon]|nr:zinc finger domain-containing protein [Methanocellales archaeon]MDD3291190.1 zinc finger domain-containing protein [Methanocellales archaeon]MDD5235290.1 zinc finger domain-containing protein [Methanocellales archaeon]MDD5484554.1 zinc finger domain-containing protein [Methanocellales archaeon]